MTVTNGSHHDIITFCVTFFGLYHYIQSHFVAQMIIFANFAHLFFRKTCTNFITPMIEYFKLANFMSYKDETELSFLASNKDGGRKELPSYWFKTINDKRILRLIIGIGLNGSGKTKMIKGLGYLRKLAIYKPESPTDSVDYRPFLLDSDSIYKPSEFWLSYYINETNYLYHIKVSNERIEEEELRILNTPRGQRVFLRTYNVESQKVEITFGQACDMSKAEQIILEFNTVNNTSVLAQFGSMNLESKVMRGSFEYFYYRLNRIHKGEISLAERLDTGDKERDEKMKHLLLKLLKDLGTNIIDYHVDQSPIQLEEIVGSENRDVMLEALLKKFPNGYIPNKTLRFDHSTLQGNRSLDFSYESLGTMNIIKLLVILYDTYIGKKCTCIDELGTGIHSIALEFVLRMYLSIADECQVFVATHDLSLLNPRFFRLRRDSIRKFTKDENGETHVERVRYLHNTLNLYKRYMDELEEEIPQALRDDTIMYDYKDIVK